MNTALFHSFLVLLLVSTIAVSQGQNEQEHLADLRDFEGDEYLGNIDDGDRHDL